MFNQKEVRKQVTAGRQVLGLVHGVSLLKCVIAIVCENSLRLSQYEIFPSLFLISVCVLLNGRIYTDRTWIVVSFFFFFFLAI